MVGAKWAWAVVERTLEVELTGAARAAAVRAAVRAAVKVEPRISTAASAVAAMTAAMTKKAVMAVASPAAHRSRCSPCQKHTRRRWRPTRRPRRRHCARERMRPSTRSRREAAVALVATLLLRAVESAVAAYVAQSTSRSRYTGVPHTTGR